MPTLTLSERSFVLAAVGLDMDGVQRDTAYRAYVALCKTVTEFGGTPPDYQHYVRAFSHEFLPFYQACGISATADEITAIYRRHQDVEELAAPFPDVHGFLAHLAAVSVGAFVVSASRPGRLQGWFTRHGFREFAGVVSTSNHGDKRASLLAACQTLGVAPTTACYLGDLGCDMRDAREAGLIPIGVTRGYDSREALLDSGAALVVHSLEELTPYIQ